MESKVVKDEFGESRLSNMEVMLYRNIHKLSEYDAACLIRYDHYKTYGGTLRAPERY